MDDVIINSNLQGFVLWVNDEFATEKFIDL